MIPSAVPHDGREEIGLHAFHPPNGEVIAPAVLRVARISARVTEAGLAAACAVDEATIRAWEDGSQPLTAVPAPQLEELKGVLVDVGAEPLLVADLDPAAWCDLVIRAIADSADCTSLLADPLTAEGPFRELLAWALDGRIPTRYIPYAVPGALISDPALAERAVVVLGPLRPDLLRRPA